jgi:HK97 family phage major capsid protein
MSYNVEMERRRLNDQANNAVLEAERLSKGNVDKSTRAKIDVLLSKASGLRSQATNLRSDEERFQKADELAKELGLPIPSIHRPSVERLDGQRCSETLRSIVRGEHRTYSGLDTTGGSSFISQQFEKSLVQMELSAGPLFGGSPAIGNIETAKGGALKMPVCDDLSNNGYVQTEQGAPTEAEMALAQVSEGVTTFSSGIVLLSIELSQDANWPSGEQIILNAISKRLGRIQNSTFLASLMTALSSNSSATITPQAPGAISETDVLKLVASVNASYRYSDKAGFLLNSNTALALAELKSTTGDDLRIFKNILDSKPTLLGYPVYISDFADDIGSSKTPLFFGAWDYVYSRHIPGIDLQVMQQRYVEQGSIGLIARKRADLKYSVPSTSDSAIKMLKFT